MRVSLTVVTALYIGSSLGLVIIGEQSSKGLTAQPFGLPQSSLSVPEGAQTRISNFRHENSLSRRPPPKDYFKDFRNRPFRGRFKVLSVSSYNRHHGESPFFRKLRKEGRLGRQTLRMLKTNGHDGEGRDGHDLD